MGKDKTIIAAHQWVIELKASTRINYTELGDLIGYSDAGISKALKKKSLSLAQIKIIANKLDSIEKLNNYISNESNDDAGLDIFAEYIAKNSVGVYLKENHVRLLKEDPTYEMFIENITNKRSMLILKDVISKG